ncbi:hypothetical protein [Streptomyces sp. NPDC052701]|uniref:hypothetical protein n=1 Tax=Streptomyces sp. NPDC052701 TaxID=3155533 RepID=UPI00341982E9
MRSPVRTSTFPRQRRAFHRDIRRARHIFHRELGLRPGVRLQELLDAIADHNKRPVSLLEMDLDPDLSGICLRGRTEDRIIVGHNNSEWQRMCVSAHELGHLLPWIAADSTESSVSGHGHGHDIQLDARTLAEQLTTLPADVVHDVMNPARPTKLRAAYDTDEERAVEAWGTVVPTLLSLDGATSPTGAITSAFSNRVSL